MKSIALVVALASITAHADRRIDDDSFAEPTKVRVASLALDLAVDFDKRVLAGTATLDLTWVDPKANDIILDTRDLTIDRVLGMSTTDGPAQSLPFKLGPKHVEKGQPLIISTTTHWARIAITYKTSPAASGLQWLPAKLTRGGKQPFLFTQSQAIHARSWVPLQDTPLVRFSYKAHVATPKQLVALMSANNDPAVVRDGSYDFDMPQAIPSYLLALAVGDLTFESISPRCGVWAEASIVTTAHDEFADTERMISTAETLYGPYRWGRYDLLILPPSFPYGGMENPRLSFITPTAIVGDRSLASLIAHELAHSWSGNLVTNATWRDGWLNEGFTTYVEGRITEVVYGKEVADMELALSEADMRETVAKSPKAQQVLRQQTDDTEVAYGKGSWFLRALEARFGRATFDPFLRKWFDKFAFQSVTSDDFLAFVKSELLPKSPKAITEPELLEWLDGDGIPKSAPVTTSKRLAAVDDLSAKWLAGAKLAIPTTWSTQERIRFLEELPEKLDRAKLEELDRAMALTNTKNAELAQRWYPLTIRSGYDATRPAIAAFVERIGRNKLVMPIYRALAATPNGLAYAKQIFARAKPNYHPLTIAGVERILGK